MSLSPFRLTWVSFLGILASCGHPDDVPKKVFFDSCEDVAEGRYLSATGVDGPPAPEMRVGCNFGHAAMPFQITDMVGVKVKAILTLEAFLLVDPPDVKSGQFTASVIMTDNRINCPARRVFRFQASTDDNWPLVH